jgi:phosphoribosyl 1,2-cyclic phosphodiesterase
MEVVVLGSGSAGNSCLVSGAGARVLVDIGLSAKQTTARLAQLGIEPSDITAICLTHEHSDHTSGLKTFLKPWPVPVYCNAATARCFPQSAPAFRLFETGATFHIEGLAVRSFSVPHDASDPVGFRFEEGTTAFATLTDLGFATSLAINALRGVAGLLIEANYDEMLLQNDRKRPWSVKQRISSRHGHLSNAAAAEVLKRMDAGSLASVVLGHLSRDCNDPDLALKAASEGLNGHSTNLLCASQECPSPVIQL